MGDNFIPGLLYHYLGWIGYAAQQTKEAVDSHRPDNLYQPLPGDHGAHGRFDAGARDFSMQAVLNMYRGWLGVLGAGLVAAAVWGAQHRSRR
jgi:hypothetical protein